MPKPKKIDRLDVERRIVEELPWSIGSKKFYGSLKQKKYRAVLEEIERIDGIQARKEFVRKRKLLYRERKKLFKQLVDWVELSRKRFPLFYGVFVHGSFAFGKARVNDIDLVPVFHPSADRVYVGSVFSSIMGFRGENRRVPIDAFWWGVRTHRARPFRLGERMFRELFEGYTTPIPSNAWFEERGASAPEHYAHRVPELFLGDPRVKEIIEGMFKIIRNKKLNGQEKQKLFTEKIKPKIERFNKQIEQENKQ